MPLLSRLAGAEPRVQALIPVLQAYCTNQTRASDVISQLQTINPQQLDDITRRDGMHTAAGVVLQGAARLAREERNGYQLNDKVRDDVSRLVENSGPASIIQSLAKRPGVMASLPLPEIWSEDPIENTSTWMLLLELASAQDDGSFAAAAVGKDDADAPTPSCHDLALIAAAALEVA